MKIFCDCYLYKGNYRGMVVKIYAGILVDRVHRMTILIYDGQGGFRVGRGCVDQIFTEKQIGEKAWKKTNKIYVSFIDLEKAYDRVNRDYCEEGRKGKESRHRG